MCVIAGIAGATAAAGIGSAVISSKAAGNAADAQVGAANNATAAQLQMYNQTRTDQAPWRQAGGQAVNALSQFYGLGGVSTPGGGSGGGGTPNYSQILSNLPGYQFQMQQGTQAVDRNLAAQGLLQSGAAGKELQQFGQGLASNYAQQYTGGLQSLAGEGIQSNATTAASGANAANQIGQASYYSGNAQASGYANQANAINGGINSIVGGLGYMNSPAFNSTGYAGGPSYAPAGSQNLSGTPFGAANYYGTSP